MKKILVVIDELMIPNSALHFAIQIAVQEQATVFGLFVHPVMPVNFMPRQDMMLQSAVTDELNSNEDKIEKTNIEVFAEVCSKADVACRTHIIYNNFLDTLIDHTAFADLVVCNSDTHSDKYSLKNFLASSHCPVLLATKVFEPIESLVFTYDDELSSIHAIKTFTYLLRSFKNLPVHFVSVVPHSVMGIEYAELIKEWLPLHYSNATIEILKGEPRQELASFINNQNNALVIMGSFGRSYLSRFFKESHANYIIENTNSPLFIAHD